MRLFRFPPVGKVGQEERLRALLLELEYLKPAVIHIQGIDPLIVYRFVPWTKGVG